MNFDAASNHHSSLYRFATFGLVAAVAFATGFGVARSASGVPADLDNAGIQNNSETAAGLDPNEARDADSDCWDNLGAPS